MSGYQNNSIFWVELAKIQPNPYQPRREFDQASLEDLADSIRQYGVLQPLVVTRKETVREDDRGLDVHYELIAGERRLRASKIAGLQQVPVIIRKETDNKIKLELAIIENLQREDLNPIDRALAFEQLHKDFGLTHVEIGKRMGKSRVYVSNSLRLLSLPDDIKQGLIDGRISEGHTRPLLMLADRPREQATLYQEIMLKKMSVRDAEKVARKIAQDRIRKKEFVVDPKIRDYEKKLSENLGTRVHIEAKEQGGKIMIDYFTLEDLEAILRSMKSGEGSQTRMMERFIQQQDTQEDDIQASTGIDFAKETYEDVNHGDTAVVERPEVLPEAVVKEEAPTVPMEPEAAPQVFETPVPAHQEALQEEFSAAMEEFNTTPEAQQEGHTLPPVVKLPGEDLVNEEVAVDIPAEETGTILHEEIVEIPQAAPVAEVAPSPSIPVVPPVVETPPVAPVSLTPEALPSTPRAPETPLVEDGPALAPEKEVNPELIGKSFQEAQNAFFHAQQDAPLAPQSGDDPYREPITEEDMTGK